MHSNSFRHGTVNNINKSHDVSHLLTHKQSDMNKGQLSRKVSNTPYDIYYIKESIYSNSFKHQQLKTKRGRIFSQNIQANKLLQVDNNKANKSFATLQSRMSPNKQQNVDKVQSYLEHHSTLDFDRKRNSDMGQIPFMKYKQLRGLYERKNGVYSQNTSYNEDKRNQSPQTQIQSIKQSQTPSLPPQKPLNQQNQQQLNRTQKLLKQIQQNVLKPQVIQKKQINTLTLHPKSLNFKNFIKMPQQSLHTSNNSPKQRKNFNTIDYQIEKSYQLKISSRTRQGVLASNPNKTNQDIFIIQNNFQNKQNQHFFAVGDGHGSNGHFVSGFVKDRLPDILKQVTQYYQFDQELLSMPTQPKQAIFNSIGKINHGLLNLTDIDCSFSGTTLVCVFLVDNQIITANVGDSRAIIGKLNKQQWNCKQITIDHKPNLSYEAERIIKNGGRIDTYRDQNGNSLGPQRVWLKRDNIPGLAMSRSIGDNIATSVGVTWQPELQEFKLEKQDKFMLIASDGVFEFLENERCIEIIEPFYIQNDIEGACDLLMKESYAMWTQEDDSVVDDITLILIFFQHDE